MNWRDAVAFQPQLCATHIGIRVRSVDNPLNTGQLLGQICSPTTRTRLWCLTLDHCDDMPGTERQYLIKVGVFLIIYCLQINCGIYSENFFKNNEK